MMSILEVTWVLSMIGAIGAVFTGAAMDNVAAAGEPIVVAGISIP
jgi:hypothetical protein